MIDKHLDIPVYSLKDRFFDIRPIEACRTGFFEEHHRHDFFEILWFTSSTEDVHYIDFEPYPVREGLVYLMAPGQVHAFTGRKPEGVLMVFSHDFFSEIMDERFRVLFNPFLNEGLKVDNEIAGVLDGLVELMKIENGGKQDVFILRAYVKAFLLQLLRLNTAMAVSFDSSGLRMRTLFELLENGFRHERQGGYYASQLGITLKRLNEILKQRWGVTLTRILHMRLVLEAKREIGYGGKNFKEIAFELGFSDQAYFSRFFKLQTGMTPEAFRQKMNRAA
jgi:AraC-like DNA-binding protein